METKLYPALLKFRDTVSSVKKDADNPFFKSKYADLPSILEVIKTPLSESKLAITHHCKNVDGNFSMVTTLAHTESGEIIESEFPIFGNKPQEIGSSMSYARRYNILALLDIPTEDDDGNNANEAPRTKHTGSTQKDDVWFNDSDFDKWVESGNDYSLDAWQAYMIDNGFTRASKTMKEKVAKHVSV